MAAIDRLWPPPAVGVVVKTVVKAPLLERLRRVSGEKHKRREAARSGEKRREAARSLDSTKRWV